MSHVNDAIDEGIAPVRTGTPLRQLIEDAASALDYYKSPYIDDALEQIDAVLKAGSLGSIAHDRVVRIEACRDHFEIHRMVRPRMRTNERVRTALRHCGCRQSPGCGGDMGPHASHCQSAGLHQRSPGKPESQAMKYNQPLNRNTP